MFFFSKKEDKMIFIIKHKTNLRSFYTKNEKITTKYIAGKYYYFFFNVKNTNIC